MVVDDPEEADAETELSSPPHPLAHARTEAQVIAIGPAARSMGTMMPVVPRLALHSDPSLFVKGFLSGCGAR